MKKGKGFTLAELLAVITLLGLLALIIVPSVDRVIRNSKTKMYEKQKQSILTALQEWTLDNKELFYDNNLITITLNDLKEENYIDYDIKNPATGKCINGGLNLTVTKVGKKYEYSIVGGKLIDGTNDDCETAVRYPSIYLMGQNPINIEVNTNYDEPGYNAKDMNNNTLTSLVEATNDIDTTKIGSYKAVYIVTANGLTRKKTRIVNVVDTTKPVINAPTDTELDNDVTSFDVNEGVTVTDNSGETLIINTLSDVALGIPGIYNVTYTATDSSGNTAIFKRKVQVYGVSTPESCFVFDSTTGTITDYDIDNPICLSDVVIPRKINGVDVVNIGVDSFYDKYLTSVTIPNSVTTIGNYAFDDNQLTSVTIPNSVTTIGEWAFSWNNLTSVTIGNSVTTIGNYAFYRNELTSVTIGNSVTTIGDCAFYENQLTSVTIPNSVTTIGDCAFEYNNLTSVTIGNSVTTIGSMAFTGNQLTSVTIPNSVTTIENRAFLENQLTSVTIGNGVTTIGAMAFNENQLPDNQAFIYGRNGDGSVDNTTIVSYGGAKKDNIVIPNGVQRIGNYVFWFAQLTSVTIPNSVTTIGVSAFEDNQLANVVIPDSVTTLEFSAFRNNNLTSVTIGNSVTTIGNYVFLENQLTSVIIPNNVTTIGENAFRENSLTSVTIGNSVTTIGDRAFYENQLTSVTIPNSVTTIGNGAFKNNNLTSVTIGNSVTTIGDCAFEYNNLTSVTIPNSVTTIGDCAFSENTGGTITINRATNSVSGEPWGGSNFTINWTGSN